MIERVRGARDGLHAGRAVLMGDGRHHLALVVARAVGAQHERGFLAWREQLAHALGQHAGRERPEGLAELHPPIEDVLHFGLARIGHDAAIAKRARPELGAALEPANDVAFGHQARGDRGRVLQLDVVERGLVQFTLDLGGRELDAQGVHRLDHLARHPVNPVGHPQRGAQRGAGVAGRGLEEVALKTRFIDHAAIGHAVERHPARHGQVAHAGHLLGQRHQVQQDLLGHQLQARGQVVVALVEG